MYNRLLGDNDDDDNGIAKEEEVARTFSIPDDTQVYTTDSNNHCYAFVSVVYDSAMIVLNLIQSCIDTPSDLV